MALVAFSTSTTIAAVGLLVERNMYGRGGDALMVALAILSLVASLVVSSISYGTRAKAMESNYKRIQQISLALEDLHDRAPSDLLEKYDELRTQYELAIDASENHSERDHRLAVEEMSDTKNRTRRTKVRLAILKAAPVTFPYLSLLLPIALIIPFAMWYSNGL